MQGRDVAKAIAVSEEKRFFHWFLEFPEIFEQGGFDCILGNPPYLGDRKLRGTFGSFFIEYVQDTYKPAAIVDLVTYFLRRNFSIVKPGGFFSLITTNSISEGSIRKGGLDVILKDGGELNFIHKSVRWPGVANLYVSLLNVYKGVWKQERYLDNRIVDYISAHFEDYQDLGEPRKLKQNEKQMFQGSIFLGDGFVLDDRETEQMLLTDSRNKEVIFPLINGRDVNDSFDQQPKRHIINFFDWAENKAQQYEKPYERIKNLVLPVRLKQNDKGAKEIWWSHLRPRLNLYKKIERLNICFIVARTTKYLNFSSSTTDKVFTDALFVYATDNFDNYTIVQSTIHNEWARKYSSALKLDLRYSPSNCFQTYPFPQNIPPEVEARLATIGEQYHIFRRQLMHQLQLGLTKTYNLFHTQELTTAMVEKASKQDEATATQAYKDILHLRTFHKEMDNAVLAAYGWIDIDLAHNFYDMDYLPENDRTRYTISSVARKEILKRLLQLNHDVHAQEVAAGLHDKKKTNRKKSATKKKKSHPSQGRLF